MLIKTEYLIHHPEAQEGIIDMTLLKTNYPLLSAEAVLDKMG